MAAAGHRERAGRRRCRTVRTACSAQRHGTLSPTRPSLPSPCVGPPRTACWSSGRSRPPFALVRHPTCTHSRLLGPCFKTGRGQLSGSGTGRRPPAHPGRAGRGTEECGGGLGFQLHCPPSVFLAPAPVPTGESRTGPISRPGQTTAEVRGRKNTLPWSSLVHTPVGKHPWARGPGALQPGAERSKVARRRKHKDGVLPAHMARSRFRYFELSLQSPLHRSIILLVRYRFCVGIQPYKGYTSHSSYSPKELYSRVRQRAPAARRSSSSGRAPDGAVTLHRGPFQATFVCRHRRAGLPLRPTPCSAMGRRPPAQVQEQTWHRLRVGTHTCAAASLAVTRAIVVTFLSSAD